MAQSESKPVVLLIDDSVVVQRLLKVRLKNENFTLRSALTGKEAIASVKADLPSSVLLDLEMPDMDGFEVLRMLKEDSATMNVPVIVLSGRVSSEDKVTAFDLGASDYVTKPCDLAELRARLRAVLRQDRMFKLLAERAEVDGLTGLGNRAAFNKRWEEKVAEVTRYKLPLSLAMIDADYFKRVNDTYGHPAGDEVLQGIAQLLQRECRTADIVCRYGGEEFTVIMPSTGPADALAVAERIRLEVARVVWPRHPESPVTISVGLAGTEGGAIGISGEQWLELADRNLYQAKHQGRNRVVHSDLRASLPIGLAKAG